jgi:hypothetical protein
MNGQSILDSKATRSPENGTINIRAKKLDSKVTRSPENGTINMRAKQTGQQGYKIP